MCPPYNRSPGAALCARSCLPLRTPLLSYSSPWRLKQLQHQSWYSARKRRQQEACSHHMHVIVFRQHFLGRGVARSLLAFVTRIVRPLPRSSVDIFAPKKVKREESHLQHRKGRRIHRTTNILSLGIVARLCAERCAGSKGCHTLSRIFSTAGGSGGQGSRDPTRKVSTDWIPGVYFFRSRCIRYTEHARYFG